MATGKKPGKAGAVLIGLLEIGIGLAAALMGVLIIIMPRINPMMPDNSSTTLAGSFYILVGAVFLLFAAGTMMGWRWARTLMLILSWFWLFCGVLAIANTLLMWPTMEQSMMASGALSPQTAMVTEIVLVVFFTAFSIFLPGIFILFYGRKKAKENFEAWDPQESWTDRCPAPVLALSLCAALGAFFAFPLLAFYHFFFPFFGMILDGWQGAIFCILTAGIMGYSAWGAYHLKKTAWWSLFCFYIVWGISTVWTFYNHSLLEMDEKMGIPDAQIEKMKTMGLFNDTTYWGSYVGVIFLIYLGYMLFIRKYFVKGQKG